MSLMTHCVVFNAKKKENIQESKKNIFPQQRYYIIFFWY